MADNQVSRLQQLSLIIQSNNELAKAEFSRVYAECQIPLEIRQMLSTFIEERQWPADADAATCKQLYSEFITVAHDIISADMDALKYLRQSEELYKLQDLYADKEEEFVKAMHRCVTVEMAIVEGKLVEAADPEQALDDAFESLKLVLRNYLGGAGGSGGAETRGQKKRRVDSGEPEVATKPLSGSVTESMKSIEVAAGWVVEKLQTCIEACQQDLDQWSRERTEIKYKKIEGEHKLMELDLIQKRFHDTLTKCQQNVSKVTGSGRLVQGMVGKNLVAGVDLKGLEKIVDDFKAIQTSLEKMSVIIEEQPNQIIEIKDHGTKPKETFKIKLRMLLPYLRVSNMSVKLVNRNGPSQAKVKQDLRRAGDRVTLDKMTISDFARPISQNILYEPYVFLLDFKVENKEKEQHAMQLNSCQCLFGSHTQLSKAQGYLLWLWAFPSTEPLEIQEEVPWSEFHPVFSEYFYKETGYRCTPDNIECLEKEFFDEPMVSWRRFVVDPSPYCKKQAKQEKNFTIWDWLCGAKNVLQEYPGLCKEGLIHGFITKNRADDLLRAQQQGSFLLRFSHTFLDGKTRPRGGLSVVVSTWNSRKGKTEILHSAPFTTEKSDKADSLPKEPAFGYWLSTFQTKSNENTGVTLKFLCGSCQTLSQTFKEFWKRGTEQNWNGYIKPEKMMVIRALKGDSTAMEMEEEKMVILQQKIEEILTLTDIEPGYDLYLIAPTQSNPNWNVQAIEPQNYLSEPSTPTQYQGSSPAQSTEDEYMSSSLPCTPQSDYMSATEDQLGESMDVQQTYTNDEEGELMKALSLIDGPPIMTNEVVIPASEPNQPFTVDDAIVTLQTLAPLPPITTLTDSWATTDLNTPIPATVEKLSPFHSTS